MKKKTIYFAAIILFASCTREGTEHGIEFTKSFECEEKWTAFSGDGYKICELKLKEDELERKLQFCEEENWRSLPIDKLEGGLLYDKIKGEKGYYSYLSEDGYSSTMVITNAGEVFYFYQLF